MDELLDFLYDPDIMPADFNMPYEHIQLTDLVIGDSKTTYARAERQLAPLKKVIREEKWGNLSSPTFSSLIERACEQVLTAEEQQEIIYDINIFSDCANYLLDSIDKIMSISQYNPNLVVEIAGYVMMIIEYFTVDTDIAPLEYLVMIRVI
ncbi:hypothetical protein MXB_4355 [Myxobolus squamalis]|nr:hypothetical protein MXB_4355 [Myxobolus squamalis]